ncbi:IS200/IS605 family transposase [Liquorilactobacillus hordei]|uniref:IS200 family transposase n=1 Tax=Liquorilactobacillus hordei DSM 19519 TaxID=1423759 RepID=A0A0R1MLE6_9LACO|nr:IS200/IS605 family transposase [Liquorilactobacillus hordei]KRL06261.1 IS200 family transposase [Liquorilactobacillus hordei DSM 19519]QYH52959.1 IS200/IS605 family transposase [Liquorilactobacillus hordei DSM 19519]
MSKDDNSLAHTRWNCKYHIIFTPKYRRKNIYGELKQDIGRILRRLCELKEVEIIENAMPDRIHMLVKIPPKMSVSRFMGYLKGRSAVIIHERHANLKYNYGNRSSWARGYYVSTVGLNQKTIQKYIREQESEDRLSDSMSKREYIDPFKQSK